MMDIALPTFDLDRHSRDYILIMGIAGTTFDLHEHSRDYILIINIALTTFELHGHSSIAGTSILIFQVQNLFYAYTAFETNNYVKLILPFLRRHSSKCVLHQSLGGEILSLV